ARSSSIDLGVPSFLPSFLPSFPGGLILILGSARFGTQAWDNGVHSLYRHSSSALDLQKIPGAVHLPSGFPRHQPYMA
ncbi:hypothetical protein U0070_001644, partial [Myodes glareolus]